MRWRRRRPSRAELIERKHRLEGEINALTAEVRRQQRAGEATAELEASLARLRDRHYRTRLEIDRTPLPPD